MIKIIGVRFKPVGKMYYFDPMDLDIKCGDHVIVETSRGVEYGEVSQGIKEVDERTVVKPLKGVLRLANEEDTERFKENKRKEKEAYDICVEKIEKHGLEMKLVEVEYTFDGNKILFYFTADGRVDFRELVKDLAAIFRTRIELRQIGVRDESKTLGSIGVCGRNLCCSQFLGEFVPVSIKMAKEQGLSLNPTKISGACGRLMCCLKYEQDTYEELMQTSPKAGAVVVTPDGEGTVINVALLRGKARVRFEKDGDTSIKEYDVSELHTLKAGKQAEYEEFITEEEKKLIEDLEDEEKSEKQEAKNQKNEKRKPQKQQSRALKNNEHSQKNEDKKEEQGKKKPLRNLKKRRPQSRKPHENKNAND